MSGDYTGTWVCKSVNIHQFEMTAHSWRVTMIDGGLHIKDYAEMEWNMYFEPNQDMNGS